MAGGKRYGARQKLSAGATENLLRKSQLTKPSQAHLVERCYIFHRPLRKWRFEGDGCRKAGPISRGHNIPRGDFTVLWRWSHRVIHPRLDPSP